MANAKGEIECSPLKVFLARDIVCTYGVGDQMMNDAAALFLGHFIADAPRTLLLYIKREVKDLSDDINDIFQGGFLHTNNSRAIYLYTSVKEANVVSLSLSLFRSPLSVYNYYL